LIKIFSALAILVVKSGNETRRGMHIEYWWESLDVGGWTILKWILER
jgi:hypothetical protein